MKKNNNMFFIMLKWNKIKINFYYYSLEVIMLSAQQFVEETVKARLQEKDPKAID